MSDTNRQPRHRGQKLRGSDNDWSRMRMEAGLSITDLARKSGLPRSIVGLIDKGRLVPSPDEVRALVAGIEGEAA